jgi:hypothetical protein
MLRFVQSLLEPIPEPDGYDEKTQLLELLEGKFVMTKINIIYTIRLKPSLTLSESTT